MGGQNSGAADDVVKNLQEEIATLRGERDSARLAMSAIGEQLIELGYDAQVVQSDIGEFVLLLLIDQRAEIGKVGPALIALGLPEDGGPEGVSPIDKLIALATGIKVDRDQIAADSAALGREQDKLTAALSELHVPRVAGEAGTPVEALVTFAKKLLAENAALEARLSKASAAPKAKRAHMAKPLELDEAAAADAWRDGALTIVLTDEDRPIGGIEPIAIRAETHLRPSMGRVVLEKAIDLPSDAPGASIDAAWLLADGKPVARCEIPGGLRVGGGASASLPAGHLVF